MFAKVSNPKGGKRRHRQQPGDHRQRPEVVEFVGLPVSARFRHRDLHLEPGESGYFTEKEGRFFKKIYTFLELDLVDSLPSARKSKKKVSEPKPKRRKVVRRKLVSRKRKTRKKK